MKMYPEWFIGGPLDGKDKTVEFPGAYFGIRCDEIWTAEEYAKDPNMDPDLVGEVKTEWLYTPQRFVFGGLVIQFWADFRLMSRELISLRLAELVMAPHEKEMKGAPQ